MALGLCCLRPVPLSTLIPLIGVAPGCPRPKTHHTGGPLRGGVGLPPIAWPSAGGLSGHSIPHPIGQPVQVGVGQI